MSPSFTAIDGEAIGEGADARYVLLAASTGRHVYDIEGLSTRACLDFILDHQQPGGEIVGFGIGYDVNQWIADLTVPQLRELWTSGSCIHGGYLLRWLRGRRFFVKDLRRTGRFAFVQETFGFFQSSFVRALTDWGLEPGESMLAMKQARGSFTDRQRQQIIDYCLTECRQLVELMNRLAAAVDTAGCVPNPHMWIGAGQLASRLLDEQHVKPHHRHDSELTTDAGYQALLCAYFGGRAELLRQGTLQPVSTYDLRSAYPWATTLLPSLRYGSMKRRRRYDPAVKHGIWRARWENLPGQIMPLPVRVKRTISYPRSGRGWYHACELTAALQLGYDIDITEGYAFENHGDDFRPFAEPIPRLFIQRRYWQQTGNPAQKALKLALNSIYGKTAQGFTDRGAAPKWQSYLWAGEITARTRARMLTLAVRAKDPMMIATDGLFCRKAPAGRPSEQIGGWEHGTLDWLFCAQPGVYQGRHGDDDVLKSRGFFVRDVDFTELHAGWLADGPEYVYTYVSHRFLGLGQALQRIDGLEHWRQWVDVPRKINLMPQRKLLARNHRGDGWLCQPIPHAGGDSEPYRPKGALLESDDDDNAAAMDQPMRNTI